MYYMLFILWFFFCVLGIDKYCFFSTDMIDISVISPANSWYFVHMKFLFLHGPFPFFFSFIMVIAVTSNVNIPCDSNRQHRYALWRDQEVYKTTNETLCTVFEYFPFLKTGAF